MDDSTKLRNNELPGNDTDQRNENRESTLERMLEELILRGVEKGIKGGKEKQAAKQSSCGESSKEGVQKVGEVQGEEYVNRLLDKATIKKFYKSLTDAVLKISRTERELLQQAAKFHPQAAKVKSSEERVKKVGELQTSKENKNEKISSGSSKCKLVTERKEVVALVEELKSETRVVTQDTKRSRVEDEELILESSNEVVDVLNEELQSPIEAAEKYANRSMTPEGPRTSTEDKDGTLEIHQKMLRDFESCSYGLELEAEFLKIKEIFRKRAGHSHVADCLEELQSEAKVVQKNVNRLITPQIKILLQFGREIITQLEAQNSTKAKEDAQEIRQKMIFLLESCQGIETLLTTMEEDSPKQGSDSQAASCDENGNPEAGKEDASNEISIADASKEGASNEAIITDSRKDGASNETSIADASKEGASNETNIADADASKEGASNETITADSSKEGVSNETNIADADASKEGASNEASIEDASKEGASNETSIEDASNETITADSSKEGVSNETNIADADASKEGASNETSIEDASKEGASNETSIEDASNETITADSSKEGVSNETNIADANASIEDASKEGAINEVVDKE